MKLYFLAAVLFLSILELTGAETGRSPMGPPSMGSSTYPNSGLRKRTNDVTGKGMSNSTLMGSDQNPTVPKRNPEKSEKQNQENVINGGPYENGKYQIRDNKMKEKR